MDEAMIRQREEREADFKATIDAMGKENDIARYLEMQDDLVNMLRATYADGLRDGMDGVKQIISTHHAPHHWYFEWLIKKINVKLGDAKLTE